MGWETIFFIIFKMIHIERSQKLKKKLDSPHTVSSFLTNVSCAMENNSLHHKKKRKKNFHSPPFVPSFVALFIRKILRCKIFFMIFAFVLFAWRFLFLCVSFSWFLFGKIKKATQERILLAWSRRKRKINFDEISNTYVDSSLKDYIHTSKPINHVSDQPLECVLFQSLKSHFLLS